MKKLYRFYWDCGRMGDVTGVFIAEAAQVAKAIGQEAYFGEILGKHSEVSGTLEADHFEVLTDDQEFIKKFEEYGLDGTGYNPLDYIEGGANR